MLYLLYIPDKSMVDTEKTGEPNNITISLDKYFISSSHNAYLVGDQFSDSTSEMYKFVLERECRCVEIDVLDGDEEFPVLYHGHSMIS